MQQPFGHEVALQTQAPPPEQVVPVGQAAHAPPLIPHVCADGGEWHWRLLSQQPPAHDDALQTHMPFEHVWPVAHAAHVAPPVPQVGFADVRHMPVESQQPFGHEVALHTQAPCALQAWFAAHATHCPPLAPHAVADAVMQVPFAQQPLQLMLPQLHAPLLHVCPDAHMPHALPADPQTVVDCADCATQRPCESQQPLGQEVGLQTHVPAGPHA